MASSASCDILLSKIAALALVNNDIGVRISRKEKEMISRVSYSVSDSLPLIVNAVRWELPGSQIISSWKPDNRQLKPLAGLGPFRLDLNLALRGLKDILRLNTEISQVCTQFTSILSPQIAQSVLSDMLANMELLQVFLGEIEASLMDNGDLSQELQDSAAAINKLVVTLRQNAQKGGDKPQVTLNGATLTGHALTIDFNKAEFATKGRYSSVSGLQAYSSGVVTWEVTITEVRRSMGFEACAPVSLLLGVTSNPATATPDCMDDPHCTLFSVITRSIFQPKLNMNNSPTGLVGIAAPVQFPPPGTRYQPALPPPPPTTLGTLTSSSNASATPSLAPISTGDVFIVTLNCEARTLSVFCKKWPSPLSTCLPDAKYWYPHFSCSNVSFSLAEDPSSGSRKA